MSDASAHGHPSRIGPYTVLQVLGEGGMGVVYEAEQKEPVRRRVALKMLKLGMDSREALGRFEAERQALAVMEHSGIAQIYDAGLTERGRPYFVMELVHGVPLLEYCSRRRLDTRGRVELFIQVCDAVQHAHQKGVIHRDLKPSNVLVAGSNGDARPKVIDFGVAKATGQKLTEQTVVTTYGQAIGTLAYMSPEQAEMSGMDIDTRADIYSLGVTLHELIVGKVPLDPHELGGPQFLARLLEPDMSMPTLTERLNSLEPGEVERIVRLRGTTLSRLRRELAGDLQWIVLKAMDKNRNRRYDTVNGLATDLRHFLAHEPVVARPPSTVDRVAKFVRRHRLGVAGSVFLALLVVGFAVAMTIQAGVIAQERDRAELEATKAQQVVTFLTDLFESSDPNISAGDTLSARELLRRGVERIDSDLADQDALRTDLQVVMGDVHVSLGLLDDAEALYESSLEAARATLGNESAPVATALGNLGTVARAKGELERAVELERQGLEIRRTIYGNDDPAVATSLNGLAFALTELGRYDEAADAFTEALDIRAASFPHYSIEVAQTIGGLANVLASLEQFDSSEVLQRESLAIRREVYGEGHPLVATGLNNLGLFLRNRGDLEGAEPLLRRALEIRRAIHGGPHPRLAPVVNNLAGVLRMKGDLEAAEPLYLESLDIRRALYGEVHPAVLTALNNLGLLYRTKGDLEESERHFAEAVGVGNQVYPTGHPNLAGALRMHGTALLMLDRPADAESVLLRSIAMSETVHGPNDYRTIRGRVNLAESLTALGRYDEAEELLLGAHGVLSTTDPQRTSDLGRIEDVLVEVYEAWNRPEMAERYRS